MLDRSRFRGVVVPMMSPFTPAGDIDVPAVQKIADRLAGGGVAGIFPLGTTGEAASIALDQRRLLVEATVRAVQGRSMVYAGIASNCFAESVRAAKDYAAIGGVDAVVAHPPSYYALSDSEIENYFLKLADSIPLPLVLYNIPVTTHLSIPLHAIEKLAQHPNIVAIKDSAGDAHRITDLLKITGGRGGFPVLLGSSALFSHGLKLGGVGIIPSGAHLVPNEYQAMFVAAMDKNWAEVDRLQKVTDEAVSVYIKGRSLASGLAKLKAILASQGLCGPTMLSPIATDNDQ
ncbi:MAG: dihydrodipicolinate synthase family protein [Tepidisphaeraceae bacterium]